MKTKDYKIKDYYRVLGIERTSSSADIKEAYVKLAKVFHPDKNPGSEAIAKKFAEITEAYNILGNLDRRLRYSMLLSHSKKLRDDVSLADYTSRNS